MRNARGAINATAGEKQKADNRLPAFRSILTCYCGELPPVFGGGVVAEFGVAGLGAVVSGGVVFGVVVFGAVVSVDPVFGEFIVLPDEGALSVAG